jgi:excinuclease ABC subunit A
VIKSPDWIIDPEDGNAGREIVAAGTQESIAAEKRNYSGQLLKPAPVRGVEAAK